jgi:hypothetical protein
MGARVKDMAIVGCDDIGFAGAAAVPIAFVRQPELVVRASTMRRVSAVKQWTPPQHDRCRRQPRAVGLFGALPPRALLAPLVG